MGGEGIALFLFEGRRESFFDPSIERSDKVKGEARPFLFRIQNAKEHTADSLLEI